MDQNKMNEALGIGHLSKTKYLIGFTLAVILTVISFALAATDAIPRTTIIIGLFVAALLQIIVHLYFFLHLDRSSRQRWNVITFAFSLLLIVVFVGGSIWVMFTLNARMM